MTTPTSREKMNLNMSSSQQFVISLGDAHALGWEYVGPGRELGMHIFKRRSGVMTNEFEVMTTTHPKNEAGTARISPPGPEWTQIGMVDKEDHYEVNWRKETGGKQVLLEGL